MSYKLELNPNYKHFQDKLIDIKTIFKTNTKSIHKARNELKTISIYDTNTVVKAYKIPNLLNQFVYAYIRKSKPYKAFHNARKLQELHINTPEAIGYIEFFHFGLLQESFFISKEFAYDFTMAHIRDQQPPYKQQLLQEFAHFAYDLHSKGVWHADFSGGNVLIKKEANSYNFSIVDINRMKFRPINGYEGLENFNKFWFNEDDLTTIAKEYATLASLDTQKAVFEILKHDRVLKQKVLLKRKLKGK